MGENDLEYAEILARLDEIADAVKDTDLPLDEAISLYEKAVALGMKASERIESDITEHETAAAEQELFASEADNTSADVLSEDVQKHRG